MFKKLLQISIILALIVVVLGAYTRLGDAGLGCPDWPLCYGQFSVPDVPDGTKLDGFERPLEAAKGWKELIHRYAASALGLVIFGLLFLAFKKKTQQPQSIALPSFTAFFVLLQGAFGMWTVTLLVHPGIVTIHLLGGFITTVLLSWLLFNQSTTRPINQAISKKHKYLLLIVLVLLSVQIMLGGWTSTNYAALSCAEQFPTCLNSWWPQMDFSGALTWGSFGVDYEYGVLENQARVAIQILHRIGALIITAFILLLVYAFRVYPNLKTNLILTLGLLSAQIALGILNVILSLPIIIATLHNLVALLLLLSIVRIVHKTFKTTNTKLW